MFITLAYIAWIKYNDPFIPTLLCNKMLVKEYAAKRLPDVISLTMFIHITKA